MDVKFGPAAFMPTRDEARDLAWSIVSLAIECGVMFVGGAQFLGVLSETPEGGLRMLTQATNQGPGGVVLMAEQFFDYGDVMVIMIKREVKLESPSSLIIRS